MAQARKDVFSLEQAILAPPVVERASAFRHRHILRAFERGAAEVLGLTPLAPTEARRHFGAELLRARPAPEAIKRFLQHSQQETALVALLRFLPRDIVEAELWTYSQSDPRGVRVAQTSLHHREALGNQQLAGGWGDFTDPCAGSLAPRPRAFVEQAHTHIHPNLVRGGTALGLSPQEAERHFHQQGDSLAQALLGKVPAPSAVLPRSQSHVASVSGLFRTELKFRVKPEDLPQKSRPSSGLRPPR